MAAPFFCGLCSLLGCHLPGFSSPGPQQGCQAPRFPSLFSLKAACCLSEASSRLPTFFREKTWIKMTSIFTGHFRRLPKPSCGVLALSGSQGGGAKPCKGKTLQAEEPGWMCRLRPRPGSLHSWKQSKCSNPRRRDKSRALDNLTSK